MWWMQRRNGELVGRCGKGEDEAGSVGVLEQMRKECMRSIGVVGVSGAEECGDDEVVGGGAEEEGGTDRQTDELKSSVL